MADDGDMHAGVVSDCRKTHAKFWLYTKDDVGTPRSCAKGMDLPTERRHRSQAAGHIQQLAKQMQDIAKSTAKKQNKPFRVPRMHAGMAATAALYMHKFYMHQSFTDVPHLPMATSCLYLAYKVDSRPKLLGRPEDFLKDLIKNSYNLVTGASASGKEPWTETLAETLMKDFCYHERLLLASLGFNELELRIPGHFIVYFALGLDLVAKQEGDKQSPEDLRQRLIKYSCRMNNSIMGSHLGLVYHPEIIACSILDMTAREVLKYTANPKGRLHQDLPDPAAPWYTRMIPEKRFPSAVKFTDPIAVDDVVLSVDMITEVQAEIRTYVAGETAWLKCQQENDRMPNEKGASSGSTKKLRRASLRIQGQCSDSAKKPKR